MAIQNTNYTNNWWDSDLGHILNDVVASSGLPPMPISSNGSITNASASAIISNRPSPGMIAKWNMDEMSYVMKGEMVRAGMRVPEMQRENMINTMTADGFKGHIKTELCHILVKEMLNNGLIEFTMTTEPTGDSIYRARAYVMPDQMTKILKEFILRNT